MSQIPEERLEGEDLSEDEFRSPVLRAMRGALGLTDHQDERRSVGDLLADVLADQSRENVVGTALRRLADELDVVALAFGPSEFFDATKAQTALRMMGLRARTIAEVYRRQVRAIEGAEREGGRR